MKRGIATLLLTTEFVLPGYSTMVTWPEIIYVLIEDTVRL